jgi:hypothetical protein
MEGHYTYMLNPSVNFNGEKVNTSQFGAGGNLNPNPSLEFVMKA